MITLIGPRTREVSGTIGKNLGNGASGAEVTRHILGHTENISKVCGAFHVDWHNSEMEDKEGKVAEKRHAGSFVTQLSPADHKVDVALEVQPAPYFSAQPVIDIIVQRM